MELVIDMKSGFRKRYPTAEKSVIDQPMKEMDLFFDWGMLAAKGWSLRLEWTEKNHTRIKQIWSAISKYADRNVAYRVNMPFTAVVHCATDPWIGSKLKIEALPVEFSFKKEEKFMLASMLGYWWVQTEKNQYFGAGTVVQEEQLIWWANFVCE